MTMMFPLLVMLVLVAAVAAVAVTAGRSRPQDALAAAERRELERLRLLVDDLKELAWDHRELDPDLSTIVIDTIRTSERRGRELP